MQSLLKVQKRALRLIKSVPKRTESQPLFKSLKLLTVFKLYTYRIGLFMYKFISDKVAGCIRDMFKRTYEIHNRLTRQKNKIYIPFARSVTVRKSTRYRGVTIWNFISDNIDTKCSIYTFKHRLKDYLVHHDIPL